MSYRPHRPPPAFPFLSAVFLVGWVVYFSLIEPPPPPSWMVEAAMTFLNHIAEPMYWLLVVVSVLAYAILRWQMRPSETLAAQALRWFTGSKVVLWLAFAMGGRTGEWRIIIFALTATYVGMAGIWWLIALYVTYIHPIREHRREIADGVLPPYAGRDRRIGPKDRRQENLTP